MPSRHRIATAIATLAALLATTVAVGVSPAAALPHLPGHYINPFTDPAWEPARTDMGVDWIETKRLPVLAIGDGVILGSQNDASWPGHHLIWYGLLDGSHVGDIVYVAEHLTRLLPVGRKVKAGQKIATALPGYPWTEWGWANVYGSPRAFPCYKEGRQTNSGKEMARFLMTLGATPGDPPGAGPNRPHGRLC
jgi:hypothetical protein